MLRETAAHQIAVVYASHDDEFVSELADEILVMSVDDRAIAHPLSAETVPVGEVEHARSVTL
jgi:ABC-type glutathione transport system ATPase component